MKRIYLSLLTSLLLLLTGFIFIKSTVPRSRLPQDSKLNYLMSASNSPSSSGNFSDVTNSSPLTPAENISSPSHFTLPLSDASNRVTKKPFGIYVAPGNSPVSPEKFRGFHTGTDFETFPEEANSPVEVQAVCSGKVLTKEYANGYGGVMVESCQLDNQPITVVYGHLKLASITSNKELQAGDSIGLLGNGYSAETSGERKHLHLGFHKGTAINIRGYVSSRKELSNWIDPCLYVCH